MHMVYDMHNNMHMHINMDIKCTSHTRYIHITCTSHAHHMHTMAKTYKPPSAVIIELLTSKLSPGNLNIVNWFWTNTLNT